MDPLFDPIGFDPQEQVEHMIELPPIDSLIPVNPVDVILTRLERRIEQGPLPELDVHMDPLARTLDLVEDSISPPSYRAVTSGLDAPELPPDQAQTEAETSLPTSPLELTGENDVHGDIETIVPSLPARGGPSPGPYSPHVDPPSSRHSGFEHRYRPRGAGSGVRRQSEIIFCTLRHNWLDVEECRECPDFEPTDNTTRDDEEQCRHRSQEDGY